ncbi:MAG: hypothetical protein LC100_16315 [Chitinophagales bacterium]|nr:hypothetical protein [Chitinophagales bacterium]
MRAPTRNLVHHPNEILCHAQNDRGYGDAIPCQARDDDLLVYTIIKNRLVIAGADPQSLVSS